ncbi:helix-turn-helix domain-containing protein [uncultured Dokdonia sp.]|uniref:helix-turn-helix domain-containing protein n=1 Tax=uncultured Dokdonia sp. TaxID=575653 RepID=UPI0026342E5C|nr:helix-turn-helix domain-containing protein [uncultured Dokdonia sp.]
MITILGDIAIIASIIIGYFISIALVTTTFYKSRANNYLALTLFLISSLALLDIINPESGFLSFLYFIMIELLIAVTIYTYFLIQIQHVYLTRPWYKMLYLPFICSVIVETILHLDNIFHLYESNFAAFVFYAKDISALFLNVFLIFWSRYLIKKSNTISKDKRRWLLRFNLFMIIIMICWFLSSIEFYAFDSEYTVDYLWILVSFLSWWVLYYGVFKLQIVVQRDEIHDYLVSKKTDTIAPKKKIKPTITSAIIPQLYALMEEEEVYKDPLLSRLDLATRLGTSEGNVSQVINQELNKSVIQFVNEYRIEAAKKLLHDPVFHKYSVEAIGMEAGFKSKSAFYSAFKTNSGMSPGAYRKLQKTS